MREMKLYLITIGVMLFGFATRAQDADESEEEAKVLFSFGLAHTDMSGLNAMLSDAGYPELSDNGFDFGILVCGNEGRFHFFYEFGFQSQLSKGSASTEYYTGDIKLSFGYGVVQGEKFALVPYLGIGMDYGYLDITKTEDPSINTVAGYISAPSYSQRMDAWGLVGAVGVYALWEFPMKKSEDKFLIGLHAGYTPRLIKQQWKSNGGEKLKGLSIPGGVNASVLLGVSL